MPDNLGKAGGRASSPVKQDTVGGVPRTGYDSAPRGVSSGDTTEDFTGKGIRGSNKGAH